MFHFGGVRERLRNGGERDRPRNGERERLRNGGERERPRNGERERPRNGGERDLDLFLNLTMHLRQDYQTILRVVRQVATLRIVLVLRMENVNEWNCSMVKIFVADVLNVKVIVHVHRKNNFVWFFQSIVLSRIPFTVARR